MSYKAKVIVIDSNKSKCFVCFKAIDGKAVRGDFKDAMTGKVKIVKLHFECFTPRTLDPVFIDRDFETALVRRLEEWNRQFEPHDLKVLMKKCFKFDLHSKFFRMWMQVFKFFKIEEVVKFGIICKEFYMVSRNAEVLSEITAIPDLQGENIISKYITEKFGSCVECRANENLIKCVILKRCFCQKCFAKRYIFRGINKKFSLRTVNDLMKQYGVDRNFFDKIPTCMDQFFLQRTYPYIVEKFIDWNPIEVIRMTRKRSKFNE